jgi:glycerol-3-phosphate responsive antiterminator
MDILNLVKRIDLELILNNLEEKDEFLYAFVYDDKGNVIDQKLIMKVQDFVDFVKEYEENTNFFIDLDLYKGTEKVETVFHYIIGSE